MELLEKLKHPNYNKYKFEATIERDMRNWLIANTNVYTTDISMAELRALIVHGYKTNPKCACGKLIEFKHGKYKTFCSCKCSALSSDTKEQRKATVFNNYGVNNISQSQIVKEKKIETYIENFGAPHFMQSESGKQKQVDTLVKKYGVSNPSQLDHVRIQTKTRWNDNREEYSKRIKRGRYQFSIEQLDAKLAIHKLSRNFDASTYQGCDRKNKYSFTCLTCNSGFLGHIDDGAIPRCPICNPSLVSIGTSDIEQKLLVDISKLVPDPILPHNRFIISPLELDITIPSKSIAIELNGLYWHSDLNGKDRSYHLNKTKKCQSAGYRLIHIFEDEYKFSREIVLSRLKHMLKLTKYSLYARKCVIKDITVDLKNKFLTKYHIQGEDKSSIRLGAFYKNRLIAVMTFSKRRFDSKEGVELVRYATISSFNCIGVAGKLLKHFERSHKPTAIISYADLRWSDGNLYTKLGFTNMGNSSPNYYYIDQNSVKRYSRLAFQKHKLQTKLPIFDPMLSEWENMKANGYDRIWDCGNIVFEKTY